MSEKFEPLEDEPAMLITVGEGRFEATPVNTSLFSYLGRIACYSHVFMHTGDKDEKTMIGTYVFASHTIYEEMVEYMIENDYPLHVNLREVANCDINAYNSFIEQQLDDTDCIPEDWT